MEDREGIIMFSGQDFLNIYDEDSIVDKYKVEDFRKHPNVMCLVDTTSTSGEGMWILDQWKEFLTNKGVPWVHVATRTKNMLWKRLLA